MAIKLIKKKDKYTYIQDGMKGKEIPKVYPLICDRLTLTCDFPKNVQKEIIYNFSDKNFKSKKKKRYNHSIYIPGLEKAFAPYVEPVYGAETSAYIQCDPVDKNARFLRIQFNPAKLSDLEELRAIVNTNWLTHPKYDFDYLLENAQISWVDFAVDIANETVNGLLFHSKKIQCCEIIQTNSGRTEYLGTDKNASKRFRIYDKVPSIKKQNQKAWKKSELDPVPKFDVLRIEVTLKPKCKLHELLSIYGNPFSPLVVVSYSSVKSSSKFNKLELALWDMFLSLSRFEGAQTAINRIPKYQKAKFRKRLEKGVSSWWNPEYIWGQSSDIIKQLFGSE